ncbi:MAG: LemA family protein [Euryarchaeota archaeon]|nr:LemA family protein [Euryarchaeota archaeon]
MANLSNKKLIIIAAVIAVVVIMLLWVVFAYSGIVDNEQKVNSAGSQIKNRYTTKLSVLSELEPELRGFAQYESSLLTNITSLRSQWTNAISSGASTDELANISAGVDDTFATLYAVYENYPDLDYSAHVSQYMGEIVDLNEQLSYSRSQYNDAVQEYNSGIKSFPMMMFAGAWGFEEREYWGEQLTGDGSNL